MTAIIVTANILCCIGYTIIGLLGYTAYGNEVEADILNNLPTDWLIQSARVVMALSCACCGFPVNFFPIRSAGLILLRKVHGPAAPPQASTQLSNGGNETPRSRLGPGRAAGPLSPASVSTVAAA